MVCSLRIALLSLLVLASLSASGASHGADSLSAASRNSEVSGQPGAYALQKAYVHYNWSASGVLNIDLLSETGDVLLSGHAQYGRVEIDGLRFEFDGSTVYVFDGSAYIAAINLSRQAELLSGGVGRELMTHLQGTRARKAALFQAFANSLFTASGASTNTLSVKAWCDFGAGCACNQATLLTFGAVLSTAGSALSGNWLGYAGGLIATGVAYNNELDSCGGWR